MLPTFALVAAAWAMAWIEAGSVDAGDWLIYASLAALLAAIVLVSGSASVPRRTALVAVTALFALAAWEVVSLTWSAAPSLARDEGLLAAFYAIALAVPLLTLRTDLDRLAAAAAIAGGASSLALATGFVLRFGSNPTDLFADGRLAFPVSYPNAQAAIFLVGFWPAVILAARRRAPSLVRGLALGGAVVVLAGWLLTQSKGGALALGLSALALFGLAPARLRLLVPTLLAAAFVASAFRPLTAPFRARGETTFAHAIRHGGTTLIWLAGAAALAGSVYAFADRRIDVPSRATRAAGGLVLVALAAALAASVAVFFVSVEHPRRFLDDKWRAFKHLPSHETGSTHLVTLGSNRYDFWRVALDEFAQHPLAGIGGRGFQAAYLEKRRSAETPARAHSLELDTLSEEGIVGFALLCAALGPLLGLAAMRSRRGDAAAAAAFGSGAYCLVHATGDWTWTFPAIGLPLFALLGIGAAGEQGRPLPGKAAVPAAAAACAIALFAFAPPWLSTRFTTQALRGSASPSRDLRWARRLDPLSVDPLVAESALARSPQSSVSPLERAVAKEPRSAALRYALGLAYLDARRPRAARRALAVARRLDPGDALIKQALRRASVGPTVTRASRARRATSRAGASAGRS